MKGVKRPTGPRCVVCNRVFESRVMRDGTMAQTCGQTACVAVHQRRKSFSYDNRPRITPTPKVS